MVLTKFYAGMVETSQARSQPKFSYYSAIFWLDHLGFFILLFPLVNIYRFRAGMSRAKRSISV